MLVHVSLSAELALLHDPRLIGRVDDELLTREQHDVNLVDVISYDHIGVQTRPVDADDEIRGRSIGVVDRALVRRD